MNLQVLILLWLVKYVLNNIWFKHKHFAQVNFKLPKEQSNGPGEVICKLAADDHAHAIVVGARDMSVRSQKSHGSVSTHIPVVVVPALTGLSHC